MAKRRTETASQRRQESAPQARETAWAAVGFGALLACACRMLHGYTYGINSFHSQFLPHFFRLLDPDLYPGDPYIATIDHLPTLFWKGLAMLCRGSGASPEAVFAAVFAAASWATWSMVYLLAREVSGSRRAALAGCVLALFNPYLFGNTLLSHDVFLRTHLDATSFALPLALAGLLAYLRGRPASAGLALGLVLWLQPLDGAAITLALALASLPKLRLPETRLEARRFAAAFAVPALPAAIWALRLSGAPAIASPEWARLIELWYPGHYFLRLTWSKGVHLAVQTALLAGLWLAAARAGRAERARAFCGGALLVAAGAALVAQAWPWRPLVCLQLLRLDGPVTLLAVLSAGALLEKIPQSAPRLCSLALAAVALCDPLPGVLPQACAVVHLWAWNLGERWLPWAAGLTLAAALAALAGAPLAHHAAVTMPIAIFSALVLILRRRDAGADLRTMTAVVLAGGMAFAVRDLLKEDKARLMSSLGAHPQFIQRAQMWVRHNTPKDAVVLCWPGVPLTRLSFRRTMVGEWVDGGGMNWAPDYGPEWLRRMEDQGYRLDAIAAEHESETTGNFPVLARPPARVPILTPWDDGRLSRLLERYRPAVVVAPFDFSLPGLVPAFRSGPYVVYLVAGAPPGGRI